MGRPLKMPDNPAEMPCFTCRRRHVKCDFGRPNCKKCEKKGVECLGYIKPIKWATGVAVRGKLKGKQYGDATAEDPQTVEAASRLADLTVQPAKSGANEAAITGAIVPEARGFSESVEYQQNKQPNQRESSIPCVVMPAQPILENAKIIEDLQAAAFWTFGEDYSTPELDGPGTCGISEASLTASREESPSYGDYALQAMDDFCDSLANVSSFGDVEMINCAQSDVNPLWHDSYGGHRRETTDGLSMVMKKPYLTNFGVDPRTINVVQELQWDGNPYLTSVSLPEFVDLIEYFNNHLCVDLVPQDDHVMPRQVSVWSLPYFPKTILQVMVGITATHRAKKALLFGSPHAKAWQTQATKQKRIALKEINDRLADPGEQTSDETFGSLLVYGALEALETGVYSAHARAAREILRLRGGPGMMISQSPYAAKSLAHYVIAEIMSSSVSAIKPTMIESRAVLNFILEEIYGPEAASFAPCPRPLLAVMWEIGRIRSRDKFTPLQQVAYRHAATVIGPQRCDEDDPERPYTRDEILQQLLAWSPLQWALEVVSGPEVKTEASLATDRAHIRDGKNNFQEWFALSSSFHSGLIIYCLHALFATPEHLADSSIVTQESKDATIKSSLTLLLGHLSSVPSSSTFAAVLGWPLFIACAEATSAEDRQLALRTFGRYFDEGTGMARILTNIKDQMAEPAIRKLWQMGDAGEQPSWLASIEALSCEWAFPFGSDTIRNEEDPNDMPNNATFQNTQSLRNATMSSTFPRRMIWPARYRPADQMSELHL